MSELQWCSSGFSDEIIKYNVVTGLIRGYLASSRTSVKRQKVDDGTVRPLLAG